jgi:hypothetical protein
MKAKILMVTAAAAALMASPALAEDSAAGGALAGGATGAAVGAVVGGPVGAAVGGVVGAATGGAAGASAEPPPPPVREYVIQQDVPSVEVQRQIVVGQPLPDTVVVHPIPKYDTYDYAVVNHERVIVDRRTGRVVDVIHD